MEQGPAQRNVSTGSAGAPTDAPIDAPADAPTGAASTGRSSDSGTQGDALDAVLERSKELGFLGPGPVAPQREHSRVFLDLLRETDAALDLGSGGGLPGLVIAWELPHLRVTLVDAMAKRCNFLDWAVAELDLSDRVDVRCGRAEELAREPGLRSSVSVVVARSFGAPGILAECAVGFLAGAGSRVLVSEPPDDRSDRWPTEGLAELGLRRGERWSAHGGRVQELVSDGPCPDRFPRRVGVPDKRPVF